MPKRRMVKRIGKFQQKRPIDKQLFGITNISTTANVTQKLDVYTATFPGTCRGIRVQGNMSETTANTLSEVSWALVKVREGMAASDMNLAATIYNPEADVIVSGKGLASTIVDIPIDISTKSMRKLQKADKLMFCIITNSGTVRYAVLITFFYTT